MCTDDGNKKKCKKIVLTFEFIVTTSFTILFKDTQLTKEFVQKYPPDKTHQYNEFTLWNMAFTFFSWIDDIHYRLLWSLLYAKWLAYWNACA